MVFVGKGSRFRGDLDKYRSNDTLWDNLARSKAEKEKAAEQDSAQAASEAAEPSLDNE